MERFSNTKINFFNYCRRRGFLKYILRDKQLNLSVYIRGKLVHSLIENFWDRLGEPAEIRRDKHGRVKSKKKYSSPEEFVEHAQRQWLYMVNREEAAKREISWRFDNELWEVYNSYLPSICNPLFFRLVDEGPPIESELEFDFTFRGIRFTGIIDEVRKRDRVVVIRDYKTERPWLGEEKVSGNPQLTLYCVGLCALCYKDEGLASRLGLEDERHLYMGNPVYISSRIKPELFMVDALRIDPEKVKTMPNLVYETQRNDDDLSELLINVEDVIRQVRDFRIGKMETIPPTERGRKCDDCDMRKACREKLEKELKMFKEGKSFQDETGQQHFVYVSPYLRKRKLRIKQRRIRWTRRRYIT